MERRPEILNGRRREAAVDRGSSGTDLAQAGFVDERSRRAHGLWRALGRRCAMLIFGAAVVLGGGGGSSGPPLAVIDAPVAATCEGFAP